MSLNSRLNDFSHENNVSFVLNFMVAWLGTIIMSLDSRLNDFSHENNISFVVTIKTH